MYPSDLETLGSDLSSAKQSKKSAQLTGSDHTSNQPAKFEANEAAVSLAGKNVCSLSEKRARIKAWLVSGVGTKAFEHLQRAFGSLEAAWHASWRDWQQKGFSQKLWQAWQQGSALETRVDQVLNWAEQPEQYLLFKDDPSYPSSLLSVRGMPSALFLKGKIEVLNEPQVAIVGSRTPTREGARNAQDMARYLAEHGISVVSGLAKGIDTAAHRGAVDAGGPTIAVVAHGLDQIYPKANQALSEEITSVGLLVSEFPLGMGPRPQHFPRRNGAISGLSLGIVVIEAALRSGSLITAKWGLEQGREVFAVPGSIHNPLSKGCHHLIRQGAKLVESAADIFEELSPMLAPYLALEIDRKFSGNEPQPEPSASRQSLKNLAPIAIKALNLMNSEPLSLDNLMLQLRLPAHELTQHLIALEFEGLVSLSPKGYGITELGKASI